MALKQTQKAERIQKALQTPTTIEERIDRYGEVETEILALEEKRAKRVKAIDTEIAGKQDELLELADDIAEEAVKDLAPASGAEVVAKLFYLVLGKCKKQRKITDMKKLADLVGLDNFFNLCGFPLGHVDDYLNPEERKQVIEEGLLDDSSRRFQIKPRK